MFVNYNCLQQSIAFNRVMVLYTVFSKCHNSSISLPSFCNFETAFSRLFFSKLMVGLSPSKFHWETRKGICSFMPSLKTFIWSFCISKKFDRAFFKYIFLKTKIRIPAIQCSSKGLQLPEPKKKQACPVFYASFLAQEILWFVLGGFEFFTWVFIQTFLQTTVGLRPSLAHSKDWNVRNRGRRKSVSLVP